MSDGRPDLRQRKRTAAMHRIQNVALDLFDAHGYAAVTVEQIAEAAEISPSSVYRYFGTKEQLVLWEVFDPMLVERLRDELAGKPPMEAARRVMLTTMQHLAVGDEQRIQRRIRHMMSEPTLEAAAAGQAYATSEMLGDVLAAGLGRPASDLEVQVFSHAIIGGLLGGVLEHCFAIFEGGLKVGAPVEP
jgi:AcrR family transcriptional regulator